MTLSVHYNTLGEKQRNIKFQRKESFRVKKRIAKKLRQRKRKILNRLTKRSLPEHPGPMLNPGTIQYEMADRTHGITYGGIGAVQLLVKRLGLDKEVYVWDYQTVAEARYYLGPTGYYIAALQALYAKG